MAELEVIRQCPFGCECEDYKTKPGSVIRCNLYRAYATEEGEDAWDCAFNWSHRMAFESAKTNRGQTAALESFRNEMVQVAPLQLAALNKLTTDK